MRAVGLLVAAACATPIAEGRHQPRQRQQVAEPLALDRSSDPLEVAVSTDRQVYRLSDSIHLQILLINKSTGDVYVDGRLTSGPVGPLGIHTFGVPAWRPDGPGVSSHAVIVAVTD